jgi:transposase
LAQRLLADGEHVVDVPAKLAARARMLDTGHGRKTDAHDAHSVAVAAVRAKELRVLALDPELEALRMLVDRREELARQRTVCATWRKRINSSRSRPSVRDSSRWTFGSRAYTAGSAGMSPSM